MVGIKVKIDEKELRTLSKRLGEVKGDIRSLMPNLGEALHNATIERMNRESSPDGTPWAELNSEYAKGKRGPKKLQEQGAGSGLIASLNYQISGDTLEYGTNKIYGAIHQHGGVISPKSSDKLAFRIGGRLVFAKSVTIPARPYLGFGSGEEKALLDVAEDFISDMMRKS